MSQDHGWNQLLLRVLAPLTAIIVSAVVLEFLGKPDAAILVSLVGTSLIMFGNLVWIVVCDSWRRWPNTSITKRLVKVISLQR